MDIAIVTGADTALGLHLIQILIRQGCRVHGIGNNFSSVSFADPHFVAHAIDLSDLNAVADTATTILEREQMVHILIHAIDVTPGTSFEQLPIGNLEAVLKVGLLGPVMLTRLLLPNLLRFRGQLIHIIPANKHGHVASAVNALIEAALREMNQILFDRARDAGLRLTNLILRHNTLTDESGRTDPQLQARIDPEQVVRTIEWLLDPNQSNIPNEITLYPRLSGAATEVLPATALPVDPYKTIVLPPQAYCPPKQAVIPTRQADRIERTIPYTDEEMEEKIAAAIEDYERDETLKKQTHTPRTARVRKDSPSAQIPEQTSAKKTVHKKTASKKTASKKTARKKAATKKSPKKTASKQAVAPSEKP